ncbi:MAG: stalk domain-containing protein, partial [Peptococcales bacterium]
MPKSLLKGISSFLIIIFLGFALNFGTPFVGVAADIKLVIDQQQVNVAPAPVIQNGRTLVPVRLVSEELGAVVNWDEATRTVHITKGNRSVLLRLDNRLVDFTENGVNTYSLCDVPPQLINNRTFVPLRLVSNALGVNVDWEGATRTVSVDSSIPVAFAPFFDVAISQVKAGQVINGITTLQMSTNGTLPQGASEVRFQLLDPQTGRGPVVARGNNVSGSYTWLPDPVDNGSKVLAVAAYDQKGNFLFGNAFAVQIAVNPQVGVTGVTQGQVIKDDVNIGVFTNFLAEYVKYELINTSTGKVTLTDEMDPQGTYGWAPELTDNGATTIRVIAYDRLGRGYSSPTVTVTADVERKLALRGVASGVVDKPVTLWVWRNFPITQVEYILKNSSTGVEQVLAQSGYSSFRWLPGPEFAGNWEVFGRVKDTRGVTHTTAPVYIQVLGTPKLNLDSVAPNQTLTEAVKLRSSANVPLTGIEYRLLDVNGNQKKVLAGGPDAGVDYLWTPEKSDAGSWKIQAVGFTGSGQTISSEAVPVKVYLGKIYGPTPIIEKSQFQGFASQLAVKSQEKTGMSAALQTAQAILETGWGQSTPVDKYSGKPSNNLFGIKGKASAGSVISNTWEEYNGNTFRVDAEFRAYTSPEESWDDHKRLLLTSARYEPYRAVMHNSTLGAWALKRAGYATDSKYPL